MEKLYRQSFNRINSVTLDFVRYLYLEINWNDRLICITGSRGTGKTTLLLQYIKKNLSLDSSVLFLSLDDIYFAENKLVDVVENFYNIGGKFLFLDEVHKYKNWSIEVKNIYDNYSDIKIVITGSSVLELLKGRADLSRRISSYKLENLSLREFVKFDLSVELPVISLSDIISQHIQSALEISNQIKPLLVFRNYLEYGCFPFYKENLLKFHERLTSVINTSLENDISSVQSINYEHLVKLKQLLFIISQSVPFTPNLSQLALKIGIERRTIIKYLDLLHHAGLINLLVSDKMGLSLLNKPEKIFLANSNYAYALAAQNPNQGNLRETFFFNQVSANHQVNYSNEGDFLVDKQYIFEIGGKSKDFSQIRNIQGSFLAIDEISTGLGNKIPLWLFGFLYWENPHQEQLKAEIIKHPLPIEYDNYYHICKLLNFIGKIMRVK